MGWTSYLKIEESKILMSIGNKASEEIFMQDLRYYKEIQAHTRNFYDGVETEEDLFDKKVLSFNSKDIKTLLDGYDVSMKLTYLTSRLCALGIAYELELDKKEIKIISEEESEQKEYKKWRIL